jgi:hypothetical protein
MASVWYDVVLKKLMEHFRPFSPADPPIVAHMGNIKTPDWLDYYEVLFQEPDKKLKANFIKYFGYKASKTYGPTSVPMVRYVFLGMTADKLKPDILQSIIMSYLPGSVAQGVSGPHAYIIFFPTVGEIGYTYPGQLTGTLIGDPPKYILFNVPINDEAAPDALHEWFEKRQNMFVMPPPPAPPQPQPPAPDQQPPDQPDKQEGESDKGDEGEEGEGEGDEGDSGEAGGEESDQSEADGGDAGGDDECGEPEPGEGEGEEGEGEGEDGEDIGDVEGEEPEPGDDGGEGDKGEGEGEGKGEEAEGEGEAGEEETEGESGDEDATETAETTEPTPAEGDDTDAPEPGDDGEAQQSATEGEEPTGAQSEDDSDVEVFDGDYSPRETTSGTGDVGKPPEGDTNYTGITPGMVVHDKATDRYARVKHVGSMGGKGGGWFVWGNWVPTLEDVDKPGRISPHTSTGPDYEVVSLTKNPAGTKEAKKVVEKFTWRAANRVKGVSIPALTQKVRRLNDFGTLLYQSNKKLDNPSGKTKLYYHEWHDGHPRGVYITTDGRWIVALGRCVVKGAGVDDLGLLDGRKGVDYAQARAVNPWARLASLVGVDVPCAKRDGGTMRFHPGTGWRCDKCNGAVPLYHTRPGLVLYDPETKILMCVAAVRK